MANYCYYSYMAISPVNFSELPFREVGFYCQFVIYGFLVLIVILILRIVNREIIKFVILFLRGRNEKPLLTKVCIVYWFLSFKSGDIQDTEYQRRVIDTLVNSVYVYDDGDNGRKLVLTFNISGQNTQYPNTLFFVKHCFGFVLKLEDIGGQPMSSSFFYFLGSV